MSAAKRGPRAKSYQDRYKARTRDIWHTAVCGKTVDQIKSKLPKYSRLPAHARPPVHDHDEDKFVVFQVGDEIEFERLFAEYLKNEMQKLAVSRPPLTVKKLLPDNVVDSYQIGQKLSPKFGQKSPGRNLKVVFRKKTIEKDEVEEIKIEGKRFKNFEILEEDCPSNQQKGCLRFFHISCI